MSGHIHTDHAANRDKQSGARTDATAAPPPQRLEHTPAMKRKAVKDSQELHKKYISKPLHDHSSEVVERLQGPRAAGAGKKVVPQRGIGEKVDPVKYRDKPNVPSSQNTPRGARLDASDVNIHVMNSRTVNNTSVPVTSQSRAPGNPSVPVTSQSRAPGNPTVQEARRLKVKEREQARVARQKHRAVKGNDHSPARTAATGTTQPLAVTRTPQEGHVYQITVENTPGAKGPKQNQNRVLFNVGERTMKRITRQMSKDRHNYRVQELPEQIKQPKTYFDLALFTMCCCISPLGFIAVILSVQSNMLFRDGEIEKCKRYSKATFVLSVAGIITTILVAIVVIVTQFYTPLHVKLYGGSTDNGNT